MKFTDILINKKKIRVNNKLYLIHLDYLNLSPKKKRKKKNLIKKIGEKYEKYLDDRSNFSDNDINYCEKKLKNVVKKLFHI